MSVALAAKRSTESAARRSRLLSARLCATTADRGPSLAPVAACTKSSEANSTAQRRAASSTAASNLSSTLPRTQYPNSQVSLRATEAVAESLQSKIKLFDQDPQLQQQQQQQRRQREECSKFPRVQLTAEKSGMFEEGVPIVFSGAIESVDKKVKSGDEVLLIDRRGNIFARGVYNASSQYRVRILMWIDELLVPGARALSQQYYNKKSIASDTVVASSETATATPQIDEETERIRAERDRVYRRRAHALTHLPLTDLLVQQLQSARKVRSLMGLPSEQTTVYRLVNGEGDGLSGLIIDVFDKTVLVHSSAFWVERHKELVVKALDQVFAKDEGFVIEWRLSTSRLEQDGFFCRRVRGRTYKIAAAAAAAAAAASKEATIHALETMSSADEDEDLTTDEFDVEDNNDEDESLDDDESSPSMTTSKGVVGDGNDVSAKSIIVRENGLLFSVQPAVDQKTGFYCDQRDNRQLIAQMVRNCLLERQRQKNSKSPPLVSVLDLYCYSGGFALNALRSGAQRVVAIDSSASALATAATNAQLNDMKSQRFESVDAMLSSWKQSRHNDDSAASTNGTTSSAMMNLIESDCVDAMHSLIQHRQHFDVVICDPPKLAPTRRSLKNAMSKYVYVNSQAMKLITPAHLGGGLLLTCTCSSALTQSIESGLTFRSMLMKAAKHAQRNVTILKQTQAAMDHPVLAAFPESAYLTAWLVYVH